MIDITPDICIDESELSWRFVRGSGPGGQNVNKVATTAQLRWDAMGSQALPDAVKERLARLAGQRLTKHGQLLIEAGEHRTQARNREEALDRLVQLVRRAASPPKPRRPSKPSKSARARRLESKRRHASKKRQRRFDPQRDWG
jgi:ribosome-associated protein